MPRRRIKRKRGEGISISGPAIVRVNRRVMLTIEASHDAVVARLTRHRAHDRDRSNQRTRAQRRKGDRRERQPGTADKSHE